MPTPFPPEKLPSLRRKILTWFQKRGRSLPWRNETDPYRVWVSEIMLQQTTTETVKGYYARFLDRFPTITDLANAEIAEVLKYWEGLGYYRRAHQLHATAKIVRDEFGGQFPTTRDEVAKLPGIGRYTVGAILSFALDSREPILEANTSRLHARILGLTDPITSAPAQKILWDFAEKILPRKEPGRFNQALTDLGRLVCLPRDPRCGECPCVASCQTAKNGWQTEIPVLKPKTPKEFRSDVAFLIRRSLMSRRSTDRNRFLFIRYPENIRWGGLWDIPRFVQEGDVDPASDQKLLEILRGFLGIRRVEIGPSIYEIRHFVTKYRIQLSLREALGERESTETSPFYPRLSGSPDGEGSKDADPVTIPFSGGNARRADLSFQWLTLEEASGIPLSSTGRKLVQFLMKESNNHQ